jgi:hypothetical protein
VIGDPLLKTPFLIDEINSVLIIKTEDDYNHLPKKVIKAYNIINSLYNYKYIFKTDDDQNLEINTFFDILLDTLEIWNDINYGGFLVNNKVDHISSYYKIHPELPKDILVKKCTYCSGRFYFLSKKAVEHLLLYKDKIENEYFEDYAIGYYLPIHLKYNLYQLNTYVYFKDISV